MSRKRYTERIGFHPKPLRDQVSNRRGNLQSRLSFPRLFGSALPDWSTTSRATYQLQRGCAIAVAHAHLRFKWSAHDSTRVLLLPFGLRPQSPGSRTRQPAGASGATRSPELPEMPLRRPRKNPRSRSLPHCRSSLSRSRQPRCRRRTRGARRLPRRHRDQRLRDDTRHDARGLRQVRQAAGDRFHYGVMALRRCRSETTSGSLRSPRCGRESLRDEGADKRSDRAQDRSPQEACASPRARKDPCLRS